MEVNLKKKRKIPENSGLTIFLIIMIFLGLSSFIYFTYAALNQKDSSSNQENKKYYLEVYKDKDGKICLNKSEICSELIYKIPTIKENANVIAVDSDNLFILYNDVNFKIYNTKTSEIKDINLENNYTDYELYTTNDKNNPSVIIYKDGEYAGLYNIFADKILYKNKYISFRYINETYIIGKTKNNFSNNESLNIINLKTDNILPSNCNDVYLKEFNSKYYVFEIFYDYGIKIYTEDFKYIAFTEGKAYLFKDGNLYVDVDDYLKVYDIDGNLVKTGKNYNNLLIIDKDYVVYIDKDNNLNIESIIDNKIVNSIKVKEGYKYYLINGINHIYYATSCNNYKCAEEIAYYIDLNNLTLTEK